MNNAAGASVTADLDEDINIDDDVGADEPGTIAFANITDGSKPSGLLMVNTVNLTSGGENIQLFLVDDGDPVTPFQLQGWTGGLGGNGNFRNHAAAGRQRWYVSNDTYQVELFAEVGVTVQRDITDFSHLDRTVRISKS